MSTPNEIIHQSVRLRIMSALGAAEPAGGLEFSRLKAITGATDGNLGAHLATLEGAGYVRIAKGYSGRRPRTEIALTPAGRRAFEDHLCYLREILDGTSPSGTA